MTNSITPPNELARQWYRDAEHQLAPYYVFVARCAAQWGAEQELEACCEWLAKYRKPILGDDLKYVRRPKPPSLKEQALAELEEIMTELHNETGSAFTASNIRRALEALDA